VGKQSSRASGNRAAGRGQQQTGFLAASRGAAACRQSLPHVAAGASNWAGVRSCTACCLRAALQQQKQQQPQQPTFPKHSCAASLPASCARQLPLRSTQSCACLVRQLPAAAACRPVRFLEPLPSWRAGRAQHPGGRRQRAAARRSCGKNGGEGGGGGISGSWVGWAEHQA